MRRALTCVAVKSSTFPVLAVTRPFIVAVATVFKSAFVITLAAMVVVFPTEVISPVKLALVTTVAAKLPVPEPVTPPVRVMVWSPVLLPVAVPPHVA